MNHVLIVTSRYYENIALHLEAGARDLITKAGASYEQIEVPGALEIPAAIRFAVETDQYDAYVALGCVVRGETSHYDIVCRESARGLSKLAHDYLVPLGNGILTVENLEQAALRADPAKGNKGGEAAYAALRMLEIRQQMKARG
jgi:6,7-dimethyl-8-ribityllumazine synthase